MTNSEEPSAPDSLSSVTSKKNSDNFDGGSRNKQILLHSNSNAMNGSANVNACKSTSTLQGASSYDDDYAANLFVTIPGEKEECKYKTTDGNLILTNYRLYIDGKTAVYNLPLGLIEQVECRDIFFIHIHCKDARYIRCTFANNDTATSVLKTLLRAISVPADISESFAFTFFKKSSQDDQSNEDIRALLGKDLPAFPSAKDRFESEIKRMEFNVQGPWRVSEENSDYELCKSYPQRIIVPCVIDKKKLEEVANFRSARRIPAVVWRHRRNGAVISRCSQPEVGWFGWRSGADEELVQHIILACADNRNPASSIEPQQQQNKIEENSVGGSLETPSCLSMEVVPEAPCSKKLLILDARSYTTAVANRARGGGCECLEYYNNCEIQFMNLANIHSIRKSFINMRQLCAMPADQPNWYSQLEGCKWLQHMSGLMKAAVTIATAVENDGRPVMVHCSDGWDRTPQMVSLAEILLDPYYRSIEGFQIVVEREWLDFGHKFGDRCGQAMASEDANERCPVFLQWLDCLHQLLRQFPSAFEFNLSFLVKLAQHTYSNLFGTFLCNTAREREEFKVSAETHSVWKFLRSAGNIHKFRNNLYVNCDKVLWPSSEVRDLVLWSQVYLGYENPILLPTEVVTMSQDSSPAPSVSADGDHSERLLTCGQLKTKTRSYENLHTPHTEGLQRRQSDPSLDSFCASPNRESELSSSNAELRMLQKASEDVSPPETPHPNSKNVKSHPNRRTEESVHLEQDDLEQNSDERSETVINQIKIDLKSVESSTDTLIAETGFLPDTILCKNAYIDKTDVLDLKKNSNYLKRCNNNTCNTADSLLEAPHSFEASSIVVADVLTELNIACRELPIGNNSEILFRSEDLNTPIQDDECLIQGNNVNASVMLAALPNGMVGIDSTSAQCEICESSKKLLDLNNPLNLNSSSTTSCGPGALSSWNGSKYSSYNTPVHSRTPSTGIPTTPVSSEEGNNILLSSRARQGCIDATVSSSSSTSSSSSNNSNSLSRSNFDVDGLTTLHDEIQSRVNSIVSSYKSQLDTLQRELQLTRDALMKQVGHKCTHAGMDRADDAISLADSVCSGEHQSVGRESQHSHSSEFSWEAVEEKDTRPPLWLPDFAVTRCMGCDGKFWLGRRKHHCRSCGKIFCADCSERTMTIPSENIYIPVRVCMSCYHRHNSSSTTTGASMVSSYAAVTSGSAPVNGHYFNISSSHHPHTSNTFESSSTSVPCTPSSSYNFGNRISSKELPIMNGHSNCNGALNAISSKVNNKQTFGTADNFSPFSNGHDE